MLNSKVNWKEGVGFEGLRASQLHVQPRTQQNRKLVLREVGGGGGGIQDCFSSEVPPLSVASSDALLSPWQWCL